MPNSPPTFRPVGAAARGETDRARGSASARGYDRAWQKVREAHVRGEPLCRFCLERGVVQAVEEVDHIVPIRERPDLRLEPSNLRSLCKSCHSARTGGYRVGRGA